MATTAVLQKVKSITGDPANVEAALKLGFTPVMVSALTDSDLESPTLLLALACAKNVSAAPAGLAALRAEAALAPRLDFLATHAAGEVAADASAVMAALAPGAVATGGAPAGEQGGKRKTKALKVSMKGTLGGKEQQAAYVEAILLLPGVTSVTIDGARDKIVVYTAAAAEVKPLLAGAVRGVRARFGVAAGGQAALGASAAANTAYYGEEEDDASHAATGKNTLTDAAGAETVEQRMARKRRARAAAKGGENAGLLGAVASVGSWLWG